MTSGRNSRRAVNAATNRSNSARTRRAAEGRRQALGAADTARRASGGATKPGPGGPRVSGRRSSASPSASSPRPASRPSRQREPEMDLNRLTLAGHNRAEINRMTPAEMRKAHADAVAKGYKKGGMATKKKGKC